MRYIEVEGKTPLYGELTIQGSKNAALPMMAASLLTDRPVTLFGCPQIADVNVMCEILRGLGAEVSRKGDRIRIHAKTIAGGTLPEELVHRMRSSIILMGPLLSRCAEVRMCYPGGCVIGARPIDLHLEGLRQLDCEIREENGVIWGRREKKAGQPPYVRQIHLPFPSVGATENLLMASVLNTGSTVLTGAACEPEIDQLAGMLVQMGARIRGIGTQRLEIWGVQRLRGVRRCVQADRIVTGTYLLAAAAAGGEISLRHVCPQDQQALLQVLQQMGCRLGYQEEGGWIWLESKGRLRALDVTTAPYPGFPTDLQAMLMVAMSQAEGTSHLTETVFESRFRHVEAIRRMGARIQTKGQRAVIQGPTPLRADRLSATDLRAGAAMVLAALCAEGTSRIEEIQHVERGYEDIARDLQRLGARVTIKEDM